MDRIVTMGCVKRMTKDARPCAAVWAASARTFAPIDIDGARGAHSARMDDYRRNRVPGATTLFTVRLRDRHSRLLTEHFAAFGEAVRHARARQPFHIDAWVVLPDHAHAIWTLPPGDSDSTTRWRAVKTAFAKSLRKSGLHDPGLWERGVLGRAVGGEADYAALVDYVHANAPRHGLCATPAEWPWSSHHRFARAGWLDARAAG
jgi:putative transposase